MFEIKNVRAIDYKQAAVSPDPKFRKALLSKIIKTSFIAYANIVIKHQNANFSPLEDFPPFNMYFLVIKRSF